MLFLLGNLASCSSLKKNQVDISTHSTDSEDSCAYVDETCPFASDPTESFTSQPINLPAKPTNQQIIDFLNYQVFETICPGVNKQECIKLNQEEFMKFAKFKICGLATYLNMHAISSQPECQTLIKLTESTKSNDKYMLEQNYNGYLNQCPTNPKCRDGPYYKYLDYSLKSKHYTGILVNGRLVKVDVMKILAGFNIEVNTLVTNISDYPTEKMGLTNKLHEIVELFYIIGLSRAASSYLEKKPTKIYENFYLDAVIKIAEGLNISKAVGYCKWMAMKAGIKLLKCFN
jgi:hypothetical protein